MYRRVEKSLINNADNLLKNERTEGNTDMKVKKNINNID